MYAACRRAKGLKARSKWPFMILVTGSITPRPDQEPEIRYQPSMLSVPSSASTVAPEDKPPTSDTGRRPGARRRLWFFAALAMAAGVASAGLLDRISSKPSPEVRSGSPGFRKAKNGQNLHWHQRAVTIHLDESLQRLGPQAGDAVTQAFGRWVESDQRLPDLSFDSGKTSAIPTHDGKSTISYGRITAPGHERDLAITVTYADEQSGEIVEADIVLNSMYPMAVLTPELADSNQSDASSSSKAMLDEARDCQNRYDVQNVTTHEAGHFFGLGEDLVERNAAMFQTIDQCETHKRGLAATDVSALSTLYAESGDPEESAAGPRACSVGAAGRGSNQSWGWISAGIVGVGLLRRRR
jgi:MYXO-CTERM domain-containing protein